MDEKKFEALLINLGIATNRSYTDIYELLDYKLSEYLDRQDEASQNLIPEIQDALEYAEQKKKEVGGGIALAESVEQLRNEVDMDELRSGVKTAAQDVNSQSVTSQGTASAGASATGMAASAGTTASTSTGGNLWFASRYGADNIDKLFYRACDDLKYQQYEQADGKFEQILDVEPDNAGAYLGKVLAKFKLEKAQDMGNCFDDALEKDINLKRAYDHSNADQKKYIDDALEERKNAILYKEADKVAADLNSIEAQQKAREMFWSIVGYRDAGVRRILCLRRIKQLKYDDAKAKMEKARTSFDYKKAMSDFEKIVTELGGVVGCEDADELAKKCHEKYLELQEEEKEKGRLEKLEGEYRSVYREFSQATREQKRAYEDVIKNNPWKKVPASNEPQEKFEAMKKHLEGTPDLDKCFNRQEELADARKYLDDLEERKKQYRNIKRKYKRTKLFDIVVLLGVIWLFLTQGFFVRIHKDASDDVTLTIPCSVRYVAISDAEYLEKINVLFGEIGTLTLYFNGGISGGIEGLDDVKHLVLHNCDISNSVLDMNNLKALTLEDCVTSNYVIEGDNLQTLTLESCQMENVMFAENMQLESFSMESCAWPEDFIAPNAKKVNITALRWFTKSEEGLNHPFKIVIQEGTKEVNIYNWYYDYGYVSGIEFPDGVESIELTRIAELTELTIPEGTRYLKLESLPDLVRLNLPESIESVEIIDCPNCIY